jgi:hypothetical protein
MTALTTQLGHLAGVAAMVAAIFAKLAVFRYLARAARMRTFIGLRHEIPGSSLQSTFHEPLCRA